MIRRIPRFDDGFNGALDEIIANRNPYQSLSNLNQAALDVYNNEGIYDEDYSNYNPQVQRLVDQFANNLNQSSTGIRPMSARPKRPAKVTTAAQDIKAAETARNKAVAAAKKKAATEEKNARSNVTKAQSTYQNIVQRNKKAGLTAERNPKTGELVYSAYANMQAGAVGRRNLPKKNINNKVSRPNNNIPGQSSDSGAKQYWAKRKAQIQKQTGRKGWNITDAWNAIKEWAKSEGLGRRVSSRPVATTRGVGQYR